MVSGDIMLNQLFTTFIRKRI